MKLHTFSSFVSEAQTSFYEPGDVKKFWSDPANKDKTIYFVDETEVDDDEMAFVVAKQTKQDYDDNNYWDWDWDDTFGNDDDSDKAVAAAKKKAKADPNGVYIDNLRVTRGY